MNPRNGIQGSPDIIPPCLLLALPAGQDCQNGPRLTQSSRADASSLEYFSKGNTGAKSYFKFACYETEYVVSVTYY